MGLAEVKWLEFGETENNDEGNKLWDARHEHGVGFHLNWLELSSAVHQCPVDWSPCVSGNCHNVTTVQVYVPTSMHEDNEREELYQ